MNNNDFLKELKRRGIKSINDLPSGYDYFISNKVLTLKLSSVGVCENMQKDISAFESWAIVLKHYCSKHINEVVIEWEEPESENEHYNRFIYRLTRFVQTYSWAKTSRQIPVMPSLLCCSAPNNNTAPKEAYKKDSEDWLENEFVEKNAKKYDAIDHQLPVGLFDGKATSKTRFTPGRNSQIDIWGIKGDEFTVFELKKPGNKPLGIISELMFYANVISDLLNHTILVDERKARRAIENKYRGFDKFYEVYSGYKHISQIRAVLLADEFHPLITKKLLDEINDSVRFRCLNITFETAKP